MADALRWIYLANAVALILHEIDSAYWREWELLRIPGGIAAFLAIHVPLLLAVLIELLLVHDEERMGLVFSAMLAAGGIFAFVLHTLLIARGRREFRTAASLAVLSSTLVLSSVLALLTVAEL